MRRKILITVLIIIPLILVAGFLFHNDSEPQRQNNGATIAEETSGCPQPIILETPVNLDDVTTILYPGQVRGGDYKRHGGFRFDNSVDNKIEVRAPMDAVITDASGYIEQGKLQYMFDFQTNCGIRYRFDHLVTLSPKLAEIAEELPEPKVDDSRTTSMKREVKVTQGEVIATAVGYSKNVFVDFGVYDTRDRLFFESPIKNPLCWFDLLSAEDAERVKTLPAGDSQADKQSDVCR